MNISRNTLRVTAGLALLTLAAACAKKEEAPAPAAAAGALESEAQQFSYAIGVDLGKSLQPVKDDVDLDALRAGLDDAFAGGEVKLDDAAREQIKNTIARKMMDKRKAERDAQATTNQEEGAKFMAENAKKEGVKTTESGLQYEELTAGEGNHPAATDQVTVHYKGTLINGEEFDSSYARGEPVTFPLNGVIKGWTEGVQLMTKGSKYRFVIPADLAYGERGAGVKIGPNETLVFEVELLDFAPAAAEGADAH